MDPTFDAFLRSWPFEPWFLISLLRHGRPLPARLARAAPSRLQVDGQPAGSSRS